MGAEALAPSRVWYPGRRGPTDLGLRRPSSFPFSAKQVRILSRPKSPQSRAGRERTSGSCATSSKHACVALSAGTFDSEEER
jgi:hypothetical protein